MLWPSKRPECAPRAAATAAGLLLPLDADLFNHYFQQLLQAVAASGGIEVYLASLAAKQALYQAAQPQAANLRLEEIEVLLEQVFTARRKLFPTLVAWGEENAGSAIADLLQGNDPVPQRMQQFISALPLPAATDRESAKAARKIKRAAWDFAAELLHFSAPLQYPLMTRWVWDQATMSGALREFIRGNEQMMAIPFDNRPEIFESARRWLSEQIAAQGIYRDLHFWIDLVLAQTYLNYFRAMAEGNLGGDFGRGSSHGEQLKKLLGIDAARKDGRSRVKKHQVEIH